MKSAAFLVLAFIILAYLADSFTPKDDTDPKGGRSGMRLYVDRATGCQYLGTFGTLAPRSDGKGGHMGCGEQAR